MPGWEAAYDPPAAVAADDRGSSGETKRPAAVAAADVVTRDREAAVAADDRGNSGETKRPAAVAADEPLLEAAAAG